MSVAVASRRLLLRLGNPPSPPTIHNKQLLYSSKYDCSKDSSSDQNCNRKHKNPPNYRGRFAPSPSGPLHFGSLVVALASWLDAKCPHNKTIHKAITQQHQQQQQQQQQQPQVVEVGEWFVRMDDLDQARVVKHADTEILKCLEAHGLEWDNDSSNISSATVAGGIGGIAYQSQRHDLYHEALHQLREQQQQQQQHVQQQQETAPQPQSLLYSCGCSRKQIKGMEHQRYDNRCRSHPCASPLPHNVRFAVGKNNDDTISGGSATTMTVVHWDDLVQGSTAVRLREDFVVWRKDPNICGYQLAAVADDAEQQITHVLRGMDLLDSTARQQQLQWHIQNHNRNSNPLRSYYYGHVPLAVDRDGHKLSKQTRAAPLDSTQAIDNLARALRFLGQSEPPPDLLQQPTSSSSLSTSKNSVRPSELLAFAVQHWNIKAIPKVPFLRVC